MTRDDLIEDGLDPDEVIGQTCARCGDPFTADEPLMSQLTWDREKGRRGGYGLPRVYHVRCWADRDDRDPTSPARSPEAAAGRP